MKKNSPSPELAVILLASFIVTISGCNTEPPLSSGIDVARAPLDADSGIR